MNLGRHQNVRDSLHRRETMNRFKEAVGAFYPTSYHNRPGSGLLFGLRSAFTLSGVKIEPNVTLLQHGGYNLQEVDRDHLALVLFPTRKLVLHQWQGVNSIAGKYAHHVRSTFQSIQR